MRAALYLRVSLDRTGEQLAVTRQREACTKIATDRGWTVTCEYIDNSISASSSAKLRPEYERMRADYEAGLFDALVCWDLDRLTRQPRQLEDWIDAAEGKQLAIVTANGEADLTTDGGRMYARIKAAVARAEIERKGARQSAGQRQRAEMGRPPRGIRSMGYTLDGEIIEPEAEIVREMFARCAAGETMYGLARWLGGVMPTRSGGGRWSPSTVRTILVNPRYAGLSRYKGEIVGKATWPPLIDESLFWAVKSRLEDPARIRNHLDTARKYLGSGIYRCGACGATVRSGSTSRAGGVPRPRYSCRQGCFARSGPAIDDYVVGLVRDRLALPDLSRLLVSEADEGELAALMAEREQLRLRRETVERDYDEGLIDGRRLRSALGKVDERLSAIAAKEAVMLSSAGPGAVLAAADPVAAFDGSSLDMRRRTISALMEVTLFRVGRGRKSFDPASVGIVWRS